MSSHSNFDSASLDRKTRLARLASVKRKQPEPSKWAEENEALTTATAPPPVEGTAETASNQDKDADMAAKYLSGRNYDLETKTVKLGFEHAPDADAITAQEQAARIAHEAEEAARKEEADRAPIDLFKLQPKKPNWDLKRDLNAKLEVLDVRTENAIAKLVRDKIQ